MKEMRNYKIYKTKELSETTLKTKKQILSLQEYRLLNNFRTLTSPQRSYILATIKNIKRYHL